jgi:hypothetical protein
LLEGCIMAESSEFASLKPLHPDSSLNAAKLAKMMRLSTEELLASLVPGRADCLKTRRDGTILDGHHRIYILRQRGVDVDNLPRDVIVKEQE